MQFFRILFALVAAVLASAQLPNVPSCSLSCFMDALGSDGCASLTDFACHCQKPSLAGVIIPCVQKACDKPAQSSVSRIVVSQCSKAGHPISIPPLHGPATTVSAVTGVTTVPAEPTSAIDTGFVSETGSATNTVTSMATGAPTSPTGVTTTTDSSSALITPSGSPSSSVPGSSSAVPTSSATPTFPGAAAPNIQGNIAGIVGVLVAVVAAYAL